MIEFCNVIKWAWIDPWGMEMEVEENWNKQALCITGVGGRPRLRNNSLSTVENIWRWFRAWGRAVTLRPGRHRRLGRGIEDRAPWQPGGSWSAIAAPLAAAPLRDAGATPSLRDRVAGIVTPPSQAGPTASDPLASRALSALQEQNSRT